MAIERVKTGVAGLDRMLNGGFLRRRHVLVGGGPGTGKTLLGLQFLYEGAKAGEKGVYISLEEPAEKVIENVKQTFPGWLQLDAFIAEKSVEFVKIEKHQFYSLVDLIQSYSTQRKAKRIVIDSSNILELFFEEAGEFRNSFFDLLDFLANLDSTTLVITELPGQSRDQIKFDLEMFVVDGVILLYNLPKEEKRLRALEVVKMRGTEHSRNLVPFKFTPNGIEVYPDEKVY